MPLLSPPGYAPAPLGPAAGDLATATWARFIVDVVNGVLGGKLNATLPVTLATAAVATAIIDARITGFSTILLSPMTANAAAIHGSIWVSSRKGGEAILAHASTANTDCEFMCLIVG